MSVLNHQAEGQDLVLDQEHSSHLSLSTTQIQFCYINPVTVEEHVKDPSPGSNPVPTSKLQNAASSSAHVSKSENTTSNSSHDCNLQNGGSQKKSEVKEQSKGAPNPEILPRYKRPPPRPPSLGSASGLASSCSLAAAAERKEEGSVEESGRRGGGGGEREERKLISTSSVPLRPPVPAQGRPAPRLPPAPLQRASSRKSTGGEETREKGHVLAENNEGGGGKTAEEKKGTNSTSMDGVVQEAGSSYGSHRREDKEARAEGEEGKEKEEDREEKQVKTEKGHEEEKQKSSSNLHPSVKKPSRPVPPPRRKTPSQPAPLCPNPSGGGSPNQGAGIRAAPPSPSRRPDVSLYSPQGGAVVGTDPDSCSTSSTEEEGETNQEQEQNQSRPSDSRSPKASVKRTSTTIILDRARHRLSTVLTGLISYDRRLTQRLVELARDPVSYFGNLVKEHRAFTLETMSRHSTSTELLQEIRQMMTQLKSYLLQSTELQALIEPQHQFTQEKLEAIVEVALCKSVLKPLREPIYRSLETLHTEDGGLQQLAQNQSLVLGSTTTALGVTTAVPEAPGMEKISSKLNSLHLEYSPQRKIELLLKTCKIIYDSMSVSSPGRSHGADDFLPVMMYVLARSNLANLQMDVEYMMELMDPSLTLGEGSYYLTTTYGALEHFKSFDQQRAATRQLSREVQDSIHRWERRRTLNKERMAQGSVQDFLTVCCPEMGSNPKTLGVLPGTTIQELTEQCAGRFEQESYRLSVCVEGVTRALDPTELALSVKNSMSPGAYCFVYHPGNQPNNLVSNYQSDDQPLDTPEESSCHDNDVIAISTSAAEEEEDSLISL
ncbi:ras and Rab interactor 3 isoform 2-T2 [Polymixia lowei]